MAARVVAKKEAVAKKKSVAKKKAASKKKSAANQKSFVNKTVSQKSAAKEKIPAKTASSKSVELNLGGMKELLVEFSPDGIVAVDRKGVIRYINAAAEKLLHANSVDMVGQKFDFPIDTHRPQEVSIAESDHREKVAEIRTSETKLGREKIYVVSLRDITDRAMMETQLRALSDVDPLTGLLNRRGFFDAAQRQLNLAKRQKWGMSLFFLDLDGLKWINDEFGHLEGDQALIETGVILRKTVRGPDIIGRYAGDEFTILAFEGTDDLDASEKIIMRLRKNIDTHNERKRAGRKISFSIGVAKFDAENTPSLENLIDDADYRMYEEKHQNRRAR
jgi:diguanylate cyclase (GGDEF)-like protein